jgi:hypothetical protein
MKQYLTHKAILLLALICFIAGAGFIGSIWIFASTYEQSRNDLILYGYNNGNIKPEKGGVIVKVEGIKYAIIDNRIYKLKD